MYIVYIYIYLAIDPGSNMKSMHPEKTESVEYSEILSTAR